MEKNDICYKTYVEILERELVPAMGCTEPIALAYCSAKARAVLGALPDKVLVEVSGNIVKNVKSVIVPNSGGRRGIEAAAAAGILAGREDLELEVLSKVTEEQKAGLGAYMETAEITVEPLDTPYLLDMAVTVEKDGSTARVRIAQEHTNIVQISKNGEILFEKTAGEEDEEYVPDYSLLTIEKIYDFADTADLQDVKAVLDRQIEYNTAIAEEGLRGDYGANIGRVLMEEYGDRIENRAKAMAAAGSDARMNGCDLPVIINSGSGNQGMTASLPVIEYAKELQSGSEKLYRALLLSNLVTLHQKTGIGRLSAYCGAVSAGAGAGAGIAYLEGGSLEVIAHTLVNALAITSGIVCDGAKASCAAKIAVAVDTGILGYKMFQRGQQFYGGDGLVAKGVENTIRNIGRLGKDGMRETDKEIIRIMTEC
ncbi:L-serine ammonia-lyase, iron-sulfur-dependent, subunit alpha [[Clostridium] symbiosum]|uniref:L-cysteine desulfidase family protein n=1 Tax=Clostridium symbiosum TaxID=1512 RepID=UPI001D062282|nr:L-serine ammonia-lyase, iron-sulfur-dependent, subunit alpha [[Clostridium] symbiosum]MCB6610321.1 L-serine ammonia-lyase, iron-sulfur-dependent, subunit alpha [[Clostridium] symbiosum]MCB6932386.1 L-serine ammonia-lyase, iron-sulfur-dependent, subunit alpha [[Clostridium] symbiosum]